MSEAFETSQQMGELQREVEQLRAASKEQSEIVADGEAAVARCEELEEKLAAMSSDLTRTYCGSATPLSRPQRCAPSRPIHSDLVPRG